MASSSAPLAEPLECPTREPRASPSDSPAARLAMLRRRRSEQRTKCIALEAAGASIAYGSELQILRAEVAESGCTIERLQSQLKASEAEMNDMGERTARMAEELQQMRAHLDRREGGAAAAAAPGPAAPLVAPPAAAPAETVARVASDGAAGGS